jgi:hypothetical protein
MDKFCVFCGNPPNGKSNEHIIPKWLIEFTGDPNRIVEFGPAWDIKKMALESREFAFDQFRFPSCENCNRKYSDFETRAKDVIERLVNDKALASSDYVILLDWLDKVRVGLWLAYNYLQKNISGVDPNYHIDNRIGNSDRAVFIYKSDSLQHGITFTGTNTPAFQYYPVCFSLRINQYCLFNTSTDFLFSKNLGLPYPTESFFTDGREIKFIMDKGINQISYPLMRSTYNAKCTEIYQPILPKPELRKQVPHLYQSNYVKSVLQNPENGMGNILISVNNQIIEYPSQTSNIWIPKHVWELPELIKVIGKQVLESQIHFINRSPKLGDIDAKKKKIIKEQHKLAKRVNGLFLKILDE